MKLDDVRAMRNSKLKETDWTQLADAPISVEKKAEYATYRQALRDLTNRNDLDLNSPQWPTKPS
jgi:hypothetical protein